MKILNFLIVATTMSITFAAAADNTSNGSTAPIVNQKQELPESKLTPEETEVIVSRLHEIRSLDMKLLSMKEKKILRKEVRGIQDELQKQDGVVFYLSGTAILIIILLLILL